MSWLHRSIKWIMIVAGVLTCTMFQAVLAPQAVLQSFFGETVPGAAADVVVRNWGALIGVTGLGLLYGAFNVKARATCLLFATTSKVVFIALVLGLNRAATAHQAGVAVVADAVMVVLFVAYLLANATSSAAS